MGVPAEATGGPYRLHRAQQASRPLWLPECQGDAGQTGDCTQEHALGADLLPHADALGEEARGQNRFALQPRGVGALPEGCGTAASTSPVMSRVSPSSASAIASQVTPVVRSSDSASAYERAARATLPEKAQATPASKWARPSATGSSSSRASATASSAYATAAGPSPRE